uniref:Fibulin 2 n=1 Tax=Oncorhynchus kisutch TaxID=8019 RepID=A0A8C7HZZ0_ONCKI
MAGPPPVEQTLRHSALVLLLLSVSGSLGQKDCTGVDCPDLSNCIEERLEAGACCTTCVQTGCTCEGYQYYDCVHAGFKNGHVPEGQSYFVDFGSTECSCPEGGGRIGCHFMPCPDVPANCIEVSEPADGCVTCERIGCVHDNQKYEAGHSFHLVACEACHCPSDGGQLMCYPVPGCDPSNPGDPHKPMLATIQEGHPTYPPIHPYLTQDKLRETERDRHAKPPFNTQETQAIGLPPYNSPPYPFNGPKLPPSNSPHLPPFPINAPIPSDHLPLFKPDHMTEDGDYDYPTTDASEPPVNDLAYPTPSSSVISVSYPGTGATQPRHDRGNSKSYDKPYDWADNGYGNKEYDSRDRQELREIYGVHEPTTDICSSLITPFKAEYNSTFPFGNIQHVFSLSLSSSISQQQCCQNVLKETRCLAGITAAKGGDRCEVNQESQCAADSYQVCCSCCVLGLALHAEGRGCDAHQHLGNPCGHVLLTCCEEGLSPNPNQTQRRKERPRPTTLPEKGKSPHTRPTALPEKGKSPHTRPTALSEKCVTSMHSCQASERCVNTVGSFVCERTVTCPAGFQLRNQVCEDIDECMVRSHNCGQRFECENTEGSFLCNPKQRCLTGFTQDSHGNCIDINECSSLSDPCSAGFHCINTVGSYTCQRKVIMCSQGYHSSPDGTRCIDVDECQTGNHGCGEGQICHNLPGSYRCECQTGYLYDALRQICSDVNECWSYPGRLCAQTCENSPGSYQCSCTAGFSLAFDGKNCEDLNECDSSPCGQECANIYGSYQCYCRQGFYLKEDGHTCEDIDECSQSIGNLCVFQCVNIPGSYQCACPPNGYTMSTTGHTCRDIDECTTGVHNCSTEQTCSNVQGGYRCLSFSCPPYYRKVSDTRCERSGCPANSVDCQTSPLRITYYQLSFQINIVIPTQIFRIGPSPAYRGDNIAISITHGNEENYFSTRKLNSFTGAVYLQRQVRQPRDFLIDVEMKLLRQGAFTTFLARIYVFITSNTL